MATVVVSAFSFLQSTFASKGLSPYETRVDITPGQNLQGLIKSLGLSDDEVEGAFVNGKVHTMDTVLNDGDKIALVPPGTPGPYRVLLGIRRVRDNDIPTENHS
ncbi:MAG: MoaD/ThiS family protein [Deltaproteobacteria bacterium]|nr:MoaD/ThiS family protein [Deltaproteobacteria bacterium]